MKHNWRVTLYLIVLFLATQLLGLALIGRNVRIFEEEGVIVLKHVDTVIGPRPETQGAGSFFFIISAVFVGTLLVLLLIKYRKVAVWRVWYALACFLTMSISLGVLVLKSLAFVLALVLTWLKLYRRNVYTHNLTEILIYAGLAVLLVPILDVVWVSILLLVVSLYDMYAVWKSKHMVRMAKFQSETRLFAGLAIPYKVKLTRPEKTGRLKLSKIKRDALSAHETAIIGGGDLAFPLLFTGTMMESLLLAGKSLQAALGLSSIIVVTSAISLLVLFVFAEKKRFYPAMPFLTVGCFVGYALVLLF